MRWEQGRVDCEYLDLSEIVIRDLGGRKATVVTQHCLKPGWTRREQDVALPERCLTCSHNCWQDYPTERG